MYMSSPILSYKPAARVVGKAIEELYSFNDKEWKQI